MKTIVTNGITYLEKFDTTMEWYWGTDKSIIPLSSVRDCYNLKIDGSPIMLTRQGGNNHFQVIWPEKVDFDIDERESFLFRKDNKLFFSKWHEDPVYREEINIREYPSGNLLEKLPGSIMTLPDNQNWILS